MPHKFQMENSRKETRHYSWLSGPLARGKTLQANGQITSHTFNIINLSAGEKKMNLVIDFIKQTLIFKDPNVIKKATICRL